MHCKLIFWPTLVPTSLGVLLWTNSEYKQNQFILLFRNILYVAVSIAGTHVTHGKPPTHYAWHCLYVVEYVSNYWGIDKAIVVRTGGVTWAVTSVCFKFTPLSLVREQWYKTSSRVWCMAETVPNNLLYPIHKGENNTGAAISKSTLLYSSFLPLFSDFKLRNVSARDL
jgi:hypothetical protein